MTKSKMFKPMLASVCEDMSKIRYPVLGSGKFDGIRAFVRGGVLVSRNLKPIRNQYVQDRLFKYSDQSVKALLQGMDGELIVGSHVGSDVWSRSSSGVMSEGGRPDFTFYVFDLIPPVEDTAGLYNYAWRYREILRRADHLKHCGLPIEIVTQHEIHDVGELTEFEEDFVKAGFEGVMIRDPAGPYKWGRSSPREQFLQKVIRKHRTEAKIIGFVERMYNGNEATIDALGHTKRGKSKANLTGRGDLGAVRCVDPLGVEFEIGTGFNDVQRSVIWHDRAYYLGKTAHFEYREKTPDGSYRFPVWLGIREDM
jgi:DNA ligase 1